MTDLIYLGKSLKVKRNTITCWCAAYHFPHRVGGGKCKRTKPIKRGDYKNGIRSI